MPNMMLLRELLALCMSVGATWAHPSLPDFHPPVGSLEARQDSDVAPGPYIAPKLTDSRGPCPGLNTLANHGYINRNGRAISRDQMITAFQENFNISESAIDTAIANAFVVCDFVTGTECTGQKILTNLTLLAEPHAFEHDHSFSRLDYDANGAGGDYQDNVSYDEDTFMSGLDVVSGDKYVGFVEMNAIRLQRESLALSVDRKGWFLEARPTMEFEAGFIFAVMSDFTMSDYLTHPKIRVDWWNYWFTNESFPYELGWMPPPVAQDIYSVGNYSSSILAAKVTSTPSPLPSDALDSTAPPPHTLTLATRTTTYEIPTYTPYYAPGLGANAKRQAASTERVSPTGIVVGVVPIKNPYVETLAISDIAAQQAAATSMMALGEIE